MSSQERPVVARATMGPPLSPWQVSLPGLAAQIIEGKIWVVLYLFGEVVQAVLDMVVTFAA